MRGFINYLLIALFATLLIAPKVACATGTTSFKAKFRVNGKEKVTCTGYKLNGNDYFKLLDMASVLSGSEKQFGVEWDDREKLIKIVPKKGETATGGPLQLTGIINGPTSFIFNDYKIKLRTYVVGPELYVNLRDLMQWMDVGIEQRATENSINLNTTEYLLPKANGNPYKGAAEAIDNKYIKDYGKPAGTIHQEMHRGYYKGTYYVAYHNSIEGYKPVANQNSTSSVKDLRDYDASNLQFYNDKVYFETNLGSAATHQDIWCSNLNGTGLQRIIKDTNSSNGQCMTIYKGKIYVCTYTPHKDVVTTIKRYGLNGNFEADLVKDKMVGGKPFKVYSFRAYSIFNDKIYYITQQGKLKVANIDGTKQMQLADLSATGKVYELVCAYDNQVYYITSKGLFRIDTDGNEAICVVTKKDKRPFAMEDISIYGDKVAFPDVKGRFGVANCDGTGRVALPNAMYDVTATNDAKKEVSILNVDYTIYGTTDLLHNDAKKVGYVKLWELGKDKNRTAWMPSSTPFVYNTAYKQGDLTDGTYYIRPAKAAGYSLGISAASQEDKAKLILWEHKAGDHRKFVVKSSGKGTYTITPKHSNKQLSSTDTKGAPVYQGSDHRWECKLFEIVKEGKYYRIKEERGNYFGVSGGKMANGTNIIIWPKSTGGSQDFIFEKVN